VIAVDAFFRDGGFQDKTDAATLVTAIDFLVERGVKVINLSLSGPANTVLESAINAAQARGVVFVAAAGNGGPGAEPSYPAAYPGVIAVTAVGHDLKVYPRASRGRYINLSAPGVHVQPAGSDIVMSGTSYAVPFVTAAAALLQGTDASLTPASIAARLEISALDLGESGHDATFGWGLLQAQDLCPALPVPKLPTQLTRQAFELLSTWSTRHR
jgi:subtilisin family serine protease